MTKEEQLRTFFMEEWWPVYPGKFCRGGKGSRAMALKAMLKHKLDEDEQKKILATLKEQIIAHKKSPPNDRKYWVIATTYINNCMWDDEIESQMDMELRSNVNKCHCGEPTIGEKYSVCAKHTESHAQRLKMMQILKDIGVATPGQSLQELSQSCREWLRQNGGSKKLFNQMISSRQQQEPGNR